MVRKMLSDDRDEIIIGDESIDGKSEDVTELMDDIDAQLAAITSEFGGQKGDINFKLTIYRIVEGKGERAYLFAALPAELPILDRLRDEYGGGNFEVWIYKNGKIFKRQKVSVEAPKKPAYIPPPQQSNDIGKLAEVMIMGFQKLGEMITHNQNTVREPVNFMEMQTNMMNQMLMMKQLFDSPKPENNMDMFLKGVEIAKQFSDGDRESNSNDVFKGLIETFGPPLVSAVTQNVENQKAQAGAEIRKPINPKQLAGKPKMLNPREMMLKAQLKNLCDKAIQGKDAGLYAEVVVDSVPENIIRQFLGNPNYLQELARIHPPVTMHAPWFNELKENIFAILDNPENEADDYGDDTPGDSLDDTGTDTA